MIAYLSLGSNLGDSVRNIEGAIERLSSSSGIRVTKRSSMYRTAPLGMTDQPRFVNSAVEIDTTLSAHELLTRVLDIEREFGRERTVRNGPRTLDIDIVFYDDVLVKEPELEIPHPRMGGRRFVLQPLAELCPDFRHPVTQQSVRELLDTVSGQDVQTLNEL
jgi:2-amino-4-hydroxy-6-hydroxymethyldihydropteridine diphosphokinase